MSFFDQRYYALTKAHMSRIGIWPEQSKHVKIILPLTMLVLTLTLTGPVLIRLHDAWRDINMLARSITVLLMGVAMGFSVFDCIQHADDIKLGFQSIEKHWEMLKNTSAVIVLHEYAEKGYYITVVYSLCLAGAIALSFCLSSSFLILDFVHPLNESRPKVYIVEAEYGIDEDKYYCLILAHTYIVAGMVLCIMAAIGTMYILWVVHVCALFEVVRFNLELIAHENAITRRSDCYYKKICDCIILHTEAIRTADQIEDGCTTNTGVTLGLGVIILTMSAVQVLFNWKHPEMLIQQIVMVIGEGLVLYLGCLTGQELINHSGQIYTTAYNLDWQDMPVNAQKLLIPILIRSSKPCCFTTAKVNVLSMEAFSAVSRTVLSYFTVFAQMI